MLLAGPGILSHRVGNLSHAPSRYYRHHHFHLSELTEFRYHAGISEYECVDEVLWVVCALYSFYCVRDSVGVLAFPERKGRSMESAAASFSLPWYKVGFQKAPAADEQLRDTDDE
jgi:hypothetical protein